MLGGCAVTRRPCLAIPVAERRRIAATFVRGASIDDIATPMHDDCSSYGTDCAAVEDAIRWAMQHPPKRGRKR